MNNPLHPMFTNILAQHLGVTTPNVTSHSTESSQSEAKAENTPMNLNQIMSAVEVHDEVLLALQAARNAAWEAAYEEAEETICFDDWLDALLMLSEPDKAAALVDIANGRFPGSFAEVYDGLISTRAEELMQQWDEQSEPKEVED